MIRFFSPSELQINSLSTKEHAHCILFIALDISKMSYSCYKDSELN